MKKLSTWLIVMFVIMFWGLRVIVAIMDTVGGSGSQFILKPTNSGLEIILLFVVLACILFIIKRQMIGALIYLVSYGFYFGYDAINNIIKIFNGEMQASNLLSVMVSIIGIVLPIAVLIDMLADKARKANPVDKKTDWFYKNENFDRQYDERADKNNYRTF